MKQEEVNQELRKGHLLLVATAKMRQKILERVQRLVDGVQYVALSEVLREVNEIKNMLSRMRKRGQSYSVALAAEIAQSLILALVLIPDRQADLTEEGDGVTDSAGSSAPAAELAQAGDDARRVAHNLWGHPDAAPNIEAWDKELAKLGDGRQLAEQLLNAPRTEDGKSHDPNGRPFIDIPPVPKALPSAGPQEVELQVRTVDEEPGVALVRLVSAADPDGPAMKGLFERRLRLVFEEEAIPGVAKFLELAQVTDIHVRARVKVSRGLGASNAKHDELRLAEVIDEAGSRRQMSRRLIEMHVVTGDLFDTAPQE